eukprot:CAMPEP_0178762786 /NCGR_PEP_ID=MMETSP0744-20121128/16744_1 /TAXON_ID=913974 /ORGANISM="Nitzschia punctata, Strain CCMP561" /LENGTH=238 /DNA_ID=CAMNT_0020417519 /DNA_START=21 /DNA_END=737 /DNA_ORIENTATION=+
MTTASTTDGNNNNNHRPLIIFCHGSGDTGNGANAWIRELVPSSDYSQWEWRFPTAEPIPYQLNGGRVTSVWYDRVGGFAPTFPEQTTTVERSTDRLLKIIKEETKRRDPGSIIIGGFSMGGAIAYQTAARWHAANKTTLGGVFGLSCYLNHDSKVWSIFQEHKPTNWPPTFIAHGANDDFIFPGWGQETYERMVKMGLPAEFRIIPGMQHDMVAEEIAQLLEFLKENIKVSEFTSDEL